MFEALEGQVVLLRLFGEVSDAETVRVSIGEENIHEGLWTASVVSSGYGAEHGLPLAGLGVLGPTRMDYPKVVPLVTATAKAMSTLIDRRSEPHPLGDDDEDE